MDGQFIDMGYAVLNDDQLRNIASHYRFWSIEKCTKPGATEPNVWDMAARLKAIDPTFKTIFYFASETGPLSCYNAYENFMQHPEWWLKDDAGKYVNNSNNIPVMDYTNANARRWWISVPLNGSTPETVTQGHVIAGVLADSVGDASVVSKANISPHRMTALVNGKLQMMKEMQDLLTAVNGGEVICNGLSFYGDELDDGLRLLDYCGGVMVEHIGVFEDITPENKLNTTKMHQLIAVVQKAVSTKKTVVLGTWPGLLRGFGPGGPTWAGGNAPTSNAGWRKALVDKHPFALAMYLTLADTNVWQQYEVWYSYTQGAVQCPDDPDSCSGPDPWYPALYQPLGAPKGPPQRSGNTYTREYQHATVYLDLDTPDSSYVNFNAERLELALARE